MASLKSPLVRKLELVLTKRFPPPAVVKLDDNDGVIGVITSTGFAKMESIDRQNLIGDLIATHLTPEERRQVQVIVGVTPDEGTGYLSGKD
jgi:hypothetical protein